MKKTPLRTIPKFKPAKFEATKPEDLPRDPLGDGAGWSFKTLAHNENNFPTTIEATDAEGKVCIYVPLDFDGRIGSWKSECDSPPPRRARRCLA